jgi:ElaB/YqjD/DUF883 family membrane-anchored ribosome-binding protein
MSPQEIQAMTDLATKTSNIKDDVGNEFNKGAARIASSANEATGDLSKDMAKLKDDMASIQQTLAKLASNAGNEAVRTAQSIGSTVADQVSELASQAATSAQAQAKTFASELEGMARRNPLGTIGGTLFVGIVIGMLSRGRG